MSNKVAVLRGVIDGHRDSMGDYIGNLWHTFNSQRQPWLNEQKELRNFLFATDTRTTSNAALPWKNSTTLPKLTQIRDNLHANYLSALFPNDEWVKWEAYSLDEKEQVKAQAIEAYIANKARQSNLRTTVSRLIYDFIDDGNAFATTEYVNETKEIDGEIVTTYSGPRLCRISPKDIVFDPTAADFKHSPKIIRSIRTIGELMTMAMDDADNQYLKDALSKRMKMRELAGQYTIEDFDKACGYMVDGFGSLHEYYQSNYVEILEFRGDYYDPEKDILKRDMRIVVADRASVLLMEQDEGWVKNAPIEHAGWRLRPDNLWAMGPLNNLVGMQYRIDHLENLKADVFDFIAVPVLKIIGDVDDFDWKPGEQIHIDSEQSDVQMLVPDTTALNADTQISILEERMELYAGAPKNAMGIRTPGEKTAFEVQALDNAAGRIFQEKITSFEINLLEPSLNNMLADSRRNMNSADIVRVADADLGIEVVMSITKEDITSNGKLRPIGARHYAAQAQMIQNLQQLYSSQIGAMIAPHTSAKQMSKLVEDILGLRRFELFQDNVALFEQAETQRMMNSLQQQVDVEQQVPVEGPSLTQESEI